MKINRRGRVPPTPMPIGLPGDFGYHWAMEQQPMAQYREPLASGNANLPVLLAFAAAIVLIGAVGMAGWLAHGNALLLSVIQSGLSWCL